MLRVAILDDHPAVLAGLRRFFDPQHDLSVIAAAATVAELTHQLDGTRADVLVLDYDLTRSDGLSHCQRIKCRSRAPAVVIYSAYSGHALVLAARVAGADGVVDKTEPVQHLLAAIRAAAAVNSQCRPSHKTRRSPPLPTSTTRTCPSWPCCWTALRLTRSRTRFALTRSEVSWRAQRIVGRLRPGLRIRRDDHNVGSGHSSRPRLS
jgi:DNA-binding NarL/FixJ family response regulator